MRSSRQLKPAASITLEHARSVRDGNALRVVRRASINHNLLVFVSECVERSGQKLCGVKRWYDNRKPHVFGPSNPARLT